MKSEMGQLRQYWRENPAIFFRKTLQVKLWSKQVEIAESVRDNERTICPAAFGCGKTFDAACIVAWFMIAYAPAVVITTAPTERLIKKQLWGEIHTAYNRSAYPLGGKLNVLSWEFESKKLTEKWYALGFATKDDPNCFTGFHGKHVLLIFDQAAGISKVIWEAAEGLMSTGFCRWLAIGNTTNQGEFANNCKPGRGWNKIHIDAYDTPNVKAKRNIYPSLIAWDWPLRKLKQWGRDSLMYRVFVLALFPTQDGDNLIPIDLTDIALEDNHVNGNAVQIGVDPAEYGPDDSVLIGRLGFRVVKIKIKGKEDTMQTVGRVIELARYLSSICHIPPEQIPILIDATGVGAGVHPRLKEKKYKSFRIMVGALSSNKLYINKRTEYAFNVLEFLKREEMSIAQDLDQDTKEKLQQELIEPKYNLNSDGVYHLEDKKAIKKRLKRSPNLFDALCLAFAPIPAGTNVEYASVTQRKRFSKKKGIFG